VNQVAELKDYVRVHARGQRIDDYTEVLDRISTDDGGGPGSWVGEWCQAGERLAADGHDLGAARRYAMAAFPYLDGPARQDAHQRCVAALDRWQRGHPGIEPLEVKVEGEAVRCWASGLAAGGRKPLLLIMGGIVTLKEQWAPVLAAIGRLGMAAIVAEMPGVGENRLRYRADSWRMLPALLDAAADGADVTQTYMIALSFSGHMALRCAVEDSRVRGVTTVGAPISAFFTDQEWLRQVPEITTSTLAHITGFAPGDLAAGLADFALTPEQLSALDIPVHYVTNLRDNIIPAAEVQLLTDRVRWLDLVTYDDEHGSPQHVRETQFWSIATVLRDRGVRNRQSAAIGLALRWARARRM
jgi:esterase FrsA